MNNARIEWMDALRGFGMIFVIVGHMVVPDLVYKFIYSFHMPLFFTISGYLYNQLFDRRWCFRKIDSLLLTYFIWSGISLLVFFGIGKCQLWSGLKLLFSGNGIGVTWFFVCLFFVDVLGAFIINRTKWMTNTLCSAITICSVALIGYLVPLLKIAPVYKSNTILAALSFWLFGYFMKIKNLQVRVLHLFLAIFLASFFWVQRVDMNYAQFGNGFLFYGTAAGFIVLLFWVFQKFSISFAPLVFIGRRSLEFMCLHSIIPIMLTFIVLKSGYDVPKCVMRVLSLSLVVFLSWLIHKYSNILSGRINLFQRLMK